MNDAFPKLFSQMLQSGQEMARAFNPALEQLDTTAFERMIPTMPADMLEMWFGKTFNREGLDAKTRLLLTIGAITAQGALAAPQLRITIRHALAAGATKREIAETIYQMSMFGGLPAMQKALDIAADVYAEEETEE
ncbi:MAG: carboxymuconolactone decarboxylase family protein [Paracoccus sp. (in: a-proteobacteria)]|uniref:carboxymuconolactone decarboxylase family protein n=1 Tax=Paracoccus sp. TaxID=267 RepID=UPI0026E004F6|nr:carboxymuconolactone decarboxylase family protein [Paracoccus sp. (in: a-proteobacteria)]MDO5622530.1 carboxymuconolactone decarboxylase family protein [Paracoccus sp. (in: a-proteobacteria)]